MPNEKKSGRELSISRLIHAPIELVWEAWTQPEHIRQWWGPEGFSNTIHKMELKPGGEWEFVMHGPDGTDYRNKHIYLELHKPDRIVMKHVSFPPFTMTASFEARGPKTLVTLHSLFESDEQLAEVIKVFKADEGMVQHITRMDDYICGPILQVEPPLVIEKKLRAPVANVWKALTQAAAMKDWYFDLPDFKPEPGFRFSFTGQGAKGEIYIHHCMVLEAIPDQKLVYSWVYEGLSGYSQLSFELKEEGEFTRLRLTHAGLSSFGVHGADFREESFKNGWGELVGNRLAAHLERGR